MDKYSFALFLCMIKAILLVDQSDNLILVIAYFYSSTGPAFPFLSLQFLLTRVDLTSCLFACAIDDTFTLQYRNVHVIVELLTELLMN